MRCGSDNPRGVTHAGSMPGRHQDFETSTHSASGKFATFFWFWEAIH
jgi:hypothetical protein